MISCRRQTGQVAIEFGLIFLLFASLLMGLFEMTRVFRAKFVLHNATFSAARTGSLYNARIEPMGAELANGMAPLYMWSQRSVEGLALALARAQAIEALPGIGLQIVSPTRQAYEGLSRQQWVRRTDEAEYRWQEVIPNDNLRWRPREEATIDTENGSQRINLQDANLLKVRALWCHRLVVPALDRLIFEIVNELGFATERQQVCTALSASTNASDGESDIAPGYYIAISADAIVRMQSPVVFDDLPQ